MSGKRIFVFDPNAQTAALMMGNLKKQHPGAEFMVSTEAASAVNLLQENNYDVYCVCSQFRNTRDEAITHLRELPHR